MDTSAGNTSVSTELHDLLKCFEKAVAVNDYPYIKDILIALKNLELNATLIDKSRAGYHVSNLRKSYLNSVSPEIQEIVLLCKEILVNWKRVMTQAANHPAGDLKLRLKKGSGLTSVSDSHDPHITNHSTEMNDVAAAEPPLDEKRQKVLNLMKTALSLTAEDNVSKDRVARMIEAAIHSMYPNRTHLKDYEAKVRSLYSNLRKNQELRDDLLKGVLSGSELVHLPTEQLAPGSVREARQRLTEADTDSRRLDWVEAHREEIQRDNGLDPNNVWVYDEDSEISEND